jgi:hypothetical protein
LDSLKLAYAALGEAGRVVEFHAQVLAIDREISNRHSEGADLSIIWALPVIASASRNWRSSVRKKRKNP